ncbi:hypothetical protein GQ457_13G014900 [Hibiscus cannabinus]
MAVNCCNDAFAGKTKIYLVLEYATGGELFVRVVSIQREAEGRKLFQLLIDAVGYCHRDLKLLLLINSSNGLNSAFSLNVLIDAKGNVKISDFGLCACGSPNYVAPVILANRGYDGATSDIWSCGIFKGDLLIPKWLSPGARNMIRRILDPNPETRITIAGIKEDGWFRRDYTPAVPDDEEEDIHIDV